MTSPYPASLPPGCTATSYEAHHHLLPLLLAPVPSSAFAPSVLSTSSGPNPASGLRPVPVGDSSTSSLSAPIFSSETLSPVAPTLPACSTEPPPSIHYTPLLRPTLNFPSLPFANSHPVAATPPTQTPTTATTLAQHNRHSFSTHFISFSPAEPPGSVPAHAATFLQHSDLVPTSMSHPASAAAMAAAAGTPPQPIRNAQEQDQHLSKMVTSTPIQLFQPEAFAKSQLPSSLIAASSAGPVPRLLPAQSQSHTPPPNVSFAAAAAAATAAAAASSLPRPNSNSRSFFSSFPPTPQLDKENALLGSAGHSHQFVNDHIYHTPHPAFQSPHMPNSLVRSDSKRLLDAAQIKDRPSKKARNSDASIKLDADENSDIPHPSEMPVIEDDGRKPPFSYATLIGMAILRSPNRRLTLAQIYKWITDHFLHYRNADSGWQNSIRHNLSLNKAFQKVERPKDDPGKGHYWVIQAGMEQQFLKDRPSRRNTVSNTTPSSSFVVNPAAPSSRVSYPSQGTNSASMTPEVNGSSRPPTAGSMGPSLRSIGNGSPTFSPPVNSFMREYTNRADSQLSHRGSNTDLSKQNLRSSPPLQLQGMGTDINSSPPNMAGMVGGSGSSTRPSSQSGSMPSSILRQSIRHERGTPPPGLPLSNFDKVGSSGKLADSGYWSPIDSSIKRPGVQNVIVPTDTELKERKKVQKSTYATLSKQRGRAEEELARLRGTTAESDSPLQTGRPNWPSASVLSSPPREKTAGAETGDDDSQRRRKGSHLKIVKPQTSMIDTSCKTPLTPPVMFKKPAQEPPSASPNTTLKNHRESIRQLLGSPDVNLGGIMGDFHSCYDNNLGSSPLKTISPIKFNPDDWGVLRTPIPSTQKGARFRHEDDPSVYNSSPVRNYSDHHEVYLNLVNTPKIYTPESSVDKPYRFTPDGTKGNFILPIPNKNVPSHGSPGKGFMFPPPSLKSPAQHNRVPSNPFHMAPKLSVPKPDFSSALREDASPVKQSSLWNTEGRAIKTPRAPLTQFSFPSIKKSQGFGDGGVNEEDGTGSKPSGRILAGSISVSRRSSLSGPPRVAIAEDGSDGKAQAGSDEVDLSKGFAKIGQSTE